MKPEHRPSPKCRCVKCKAYGRKLTYVLKAAIDAYKKLHENHMKTISIILLLACLSLVGCSTVPQNQTAQLAGIAEVAAFTGTAYYLADHPEKAPLFEAAKQALDGLINDGNSDPAAFSKALSALPIKELKGDKGVIVVGAAVILWDTYASQVTTLDQKQKVMPVVIAVRNGLARALVKPQASTGLNMPRAYVWRGPEPVQRIVTTDLVIAPEMMQVPYHITDADRVWLKQGGFIAP